MNTCGTCRFRGDAIERYSKEDGKDVATSYFLCQKIKHLNGDEFNYDDYPKGLLAGVIDGSGYHAVLCVETDFGCNLWEAS